MRAHVIYDGIVVNTIEVDSLDVLPNLIEATEGGKGWSYSDGVFTPPPVDVEAIKARNKAIAEAKQDEVLALLAKNEQKKSLGLSPVVADEIAAKDFVKTIQADIDYPPESEVYNPTLPPGVNPPDVSSLIITLTRQPGWNDALGWKAVITAGEEVFTPTNLAMAEYTNPNCDGYLYTTGAFQQEGDTWFAVCPPGQEKGDVDLNFGLLYGAAQLACFTLTAGVQEQIIYAYEEGV